MIIVSNVSASISGVLEPAGRDNSTGVISSQYLKDATDPRVFVRPFDPTTQESLALELGP
mgnify:CR=1 FL=1